VEGGRGSRQGRGLRPLAAFDLLGNGSAMYKIDVVHLGDRLFGWLHPDRGAQHVGHGVDDPAAADAEFAVGILSQVSRASVGTSRSVRSRGGGVATITLAIRESGIAASATTPSWTARWWRATKVCHGRSCADENVAPGGRVGQWLTSLDVGAFPPPQAPPSRPRSTGATFVSASLPRGSQALRERPKSKRRRPPSVTPDANAC
jgi:hypothetical protein